MYNIQKDNIDIMNKFGTGYLVSPYMKIQNTLSVGDNNEASLSNDGTLNAKRICINNKCTNVGFENDSINGIKLSGSWSDTAGYGKSEISNDYMTHKGLIIAGNSSSGKGKRVIIKDNLEISDNLKVFKTNESKAFVSSKDGLTVRNTETDKAIIGYRSDGSFGILTTSDKPTKISHNNQNLINMSNDNTTITKPVIHNNISDGIIIEKRADNSERNRYGMAKSDNSLMLYGPEISTAPLGAVKIGFVRGNNEFDSVLTAKNSGEVVARNRLCINATCMDEPDLMRMKTPPPPPKFSQLCLDDTCLSKKELNDLKGLLYNNTKEIK